MSVSAPPSAFDPALPWTLHPQVALRPEEFGALAYHYGTRRLVFLKSETLVALVSALGDFDSAGDAIEAMVEPPERHRYERALSRLVHSGVICGR